jgi:hypothetical protein
MGTHALVLNVPTHNLFPRWIGQPNTDERNRGYDPTDVVERQLPNGDMNASRRSHDGDGTIPEILGCCPTEQWVEHDSNDESIVVEVVYYDVIAWCETPISR